MNALLTFISVIFILWIGRTVLLPLIIAVLFWYLVNILADYYKGLVRSRIAAGILSGATFVCGMYFFLRQINPMFGELYAKAPEISAGAQRIMADLSEIIGSSVSFSDLPSATEIITTIGSSAMSIGTALGLISVYMTFIFLEQWTFSKKLKALLPDVRRFNKMKFIIHSIDTHMKKYIAVKTIISFLTGVSSYILFKALGIDLAGVWAFIVFVLNYIPTIGSIVAGALPAIYAFALTGDLQVPLLSATGSIIINFILGNILDPKMMGKTLNLSTLAILVNLVFWGLMWGPTGMFFSVPILVMTLIVCAQFDKTRWIAILLSADGKIPDKIGE